MIVNLTHPFLLRCLDPIALLENCNKFNTFANRLEQQATEYSLGIEDKENKYKGDGFELFGEMFIRVFGIDKRVGIDPQSYQIIEDGEDRGVDGHGLGTNGLIHTVQFKYRKANYELHNNEDHLGNFKANSFAHVSNGGFNVSNVPDENGKCNLMVIHCGKRIYPPTANLMLPEVKEINRNYIRLKVDNNNNFWNSFRESFQEGIKNAKQ